MARYARVFGRAVGALLTVAAVSTVAGVARGQTTNYIPNSGTSGNWHEPLRWDNGVPNAPGVAAVLNQPISDTADSAANGGNPPTGGQYVLSLMGNTTTVGSLTSNNASVAAKSFRTQFNNGVLVFDSGSAAPAELNENLGASTALESRMRFNVPVILNSNLVVNSNQALMRNTHTEFAQRLDGGPGITLTKQGLGNLQFGHAGTLGESEGFFGNVEILQGGIRVIIPGTVDPSTLNPVFSKAAGISVSSGAQLQFGNALSKVELGPGAELKLNGPGKPAFPGLTTADGALRFDGAGEVVCSFDSPVNLQTASRINVADSPGTGVLSKEVRGGGQLEKSGNGLLKLTSTNIYTGGTVVSSGALAVNNTAGSGVGTGDVAVNGAILGGSGTLGTVGDASNVVLTGGTLAPGNLTGTLGASLPLPQLPNLNTSPGVLSIMGSLSFDSASSLHIDLTGSAVGAQYDQVLSNGSISLGGATLNFSLGDFVPVGNETFTLINNTGVAAINGEFGNYTQGAMVDLAGKTFFINYQGGAGGNDVVLSPTAPGIENANFDGDGDVDGADFLIWQRGFGGPGAASQGDANADGQVNGADFAIWKNQFGTTGLAAPAIGAVPEPTAVAMLLGAAGAALLSRRRWVSCN